MDCPMDHDMLSATHRSWYEMGSPTILAFNDEESIFSDSSFWVMRRSLGAR